MTIQSPTCWNQTKCKASAFVEILARDGNCCSVQKATSKTWVKRVRSNTCYILWQTNAPLPSPRWCCRVSWALRHLLTLAQHRAIRLPALPHLPPLAFPGWVGAGWVWGAPQPSAVLCARATGLWAQGWPQSWAELPPHGSVPGQHKARPCWPERCPNAWHS